MTTVRANKEHPAMFPVELLWRCIKMHSDKGEIVLEPFSGQLLPVQVQKELLNLLLINYFG